MALLDILKKAKKKVDEAIPDFNIRQKAGQAVKQVGRTISNIEQTSQRAGSQARRQVNRAAPVVRDFAKEIPKGLISGGLTTAAIMADTGLKGLQKAEDIVTKPLGSKYRERLLNLREKQSKAEDKILSNLKPLEEKRGENIKNYLKGAYNQALPTLKDVKTASPLQRGAALIDAALTIGTGGTAGIAKSALQQTGKQTAKQVAKQYGKAALVGGVGGAAGTATQKDATAGDILKSGVGGAIFGAGTKGAGDIVKSTVKQAPKVIKGVQGGLRSVQEKLQQPKFQPGFASTKPKVGLEPKTPKTKAPVVKTATTEKPKDIPGFIPAPEAKAPKSLRIDTSKAKERIGKFTIEKNAPVGEVQTKIKRLVSQYGEKFGFDEKQLNKYVKRNFKSGNNFTEAELENALIKHRDNKNIRNFESYISDEMLRDRKNRKGTGVEKAKILSSEDLDVPKPNLPTGFREVLKDEILPNGYTTKLDITTGKQITNAPIKTPKTGISQPEVKRPQVETDKVIREKVFKKEPELKKPAIKLKTEVKPEELARKAIGVQDTQKVVRDKVFGKETKIPTTPQQRTQFEINQAKRDAQIPNVKAVPGKLKPRKSIWEIIPEDSKLVTDEQSQKNIRKIFGKEPEIKKPAIKFAPKPETFEAKISRIASEAAENAKKEPISPEMPPVARVSTKEDISVSPEVKIKTRNEQITEASVNVKDEKTKAILISERKKDLDRIEADYKKATGKTYEEFKMEHEAGTYTPGTEKLHQQFDKLSDTNLTIAEKRHNVITPKRENYIYHITEENANKVLKEGPRKSVGDILYTPGFSKKRTGALKDYTFGKEADLAHFAESIGPTDPEASVLFRIANTIKNAADQFNKSKENIGPKSKEVVNIHDIIKGNPGISKGLTKKYNQLKESKVGDLLRDVYGVAYKQRDETYEIRQDFLMPFINAQIDYRNKLLDIQRLNQAKLQDLARGLGIGLSENPNKGELVQRLSGYYKKEFFGPATETFIKNVAKADTQTNSGLANFINRVGRQYITDPMRTPGWIEKALATTRKQFSLGMIALNINNSAQNAFEIERSFAKSGFVNTAAGIKDFLTGKGLDYRRRYGAESISSQFYEKDASLLDSVKYGKFLNAISPALYSLQQFTEGFKDTVFLSALERQGKKKGLTGDRLKDYVIGNFRELSIKMGGDQDIELFTPGGGGQTLKTMFQFSQYRIKDFMQFKDSISRSLKKEGGIKDKVFNDDMGYAFGYLTLSLLKGYALQQSWALGQRAFGGGTGFGPVDLYNDVMGEGRVVGPIGNIVKEVGSLYIASKMEEGSKRDEKIKEAQQKLNKLFITLVVPAYGQFTKTNEYRKARERGYFETGSGNVANLVTNDTWGKIRGYIAGGSYDPERQKYFTDVQREKASNLGKQESAVFKEIKERSGIDKAKEFFNSIMSKREADKALKKLEEGVGIDKPEGMSDEEWLETQATNEVLIQSGLVSNDTLADYYGRNIKFGKSGSERTINETKVFNLVNSLESDEKFKKLSDEQKKDVSSKLLEKAGIPRDIVDYYNKANNSVVVKYQMALEEIEENRAKDPNFNVLNYLAEGRRKINTKVFASQDVLKLLQQDGIITEDEYKVLNKQNYLYLDGEFKNRSVAVKLKGSGKGSGKKSGKGSTKGSGKGSGKGRVTLSKLMAGQTRLKDVPKIKGNLKLLELKTQPKPKVLKLSRTLPKPALRLKARQAAGIKPLTTKKIKVKYK